MKRISMQLGKEVAEINLPDDTEILSIAPPAQLSNPTFSIQKALEGSMSSPGLDQIIEQKLKINSQAKAVIVISDNTRPVPCKGKAGILWPIIENVMNKTEKELKVKGKKEFNIAFLSDGPYGVPVKL
jgi:nickel-dependent lactate racemase